MADSAAQNEQQGPEEASERPDQAPAIDPADDWRPLRRLLAGALLVAASIALPWWSWDATAERADDRPDIVRRTDARIPERLCDGLVPSADIAAFRWMRSADQTAYDTMKSRPESEGPGFTCTVFGTHSLRIDVLPVAYADPKWILLPDDSATALSGGTGLAGNDAVWLTGSCPQPGAAAATLLARATIVGNPSGKPVDRRPGELLADDRQRLTATAAHALANVLRATGCADPQPAQVPSAGTPLPSYERPASKIPACGAPAAAAPTAAGQSAAWTRCALSASGAPQSAPGSPQPSTDVLTLRGPLVDLGARYAPTGTEPRPTRVTAQCGDARVAWSTQGITGAAEEANRQSFDRFVTAETQAAGCRILERSGS
ncbi:hypothetical protein [Yinghuangia soli]|uniref:Uncharacterized protein n=1 Tax=Yinghuangia soli TaxID=2908204 RepID=A0AA41QA04_9ACTN|nr:hypothetical protein [Yinghuangia soli]MCF2533660.1 hypothetical protein [Yinghuangia soli]